MSIKVGNVYYEAWIDDDAKLGLDEWHVRTVRDGKAYMVAKKDWTWVKRSTKTGDYGWAAKIDDWNKKTVPADGPLPEMLKTTKIAAYRAALPEAERVAKRANKLVATLRARVTTIKNRKGGGREE